MPSPEIADAERVTSGYGILQPRVAVSLPGTNRSRYARLFGGEPGIDPYTRVVSDVYQDVFGEGSFIGKGIYDVDAFERALANRLPENRILSHDLLEGCYVRAGLLTDVQLYEEFPSRYSADVGRRHRWIRGDWQLGAWMLPRVPGADGRRASKSAVGTFAVEDFRQPAAQSCACRSDAPAAARMGGAASRLVLDTRGARIGRCAFFPRDDPRPPPQAARSAARRSIFAALCGRRAAASGRCCLR